MDYIIHFIAAVDAPEFQLPEGSALIPMLLFGLLMLAILFGSVMGWVTIIIAKINNFALPLRIESHSPPPWGIIDVLVVFGFWLVSQIFTGVFLRYANLLPPAGLSDDAAPSLWIMSLVQTLSLLTVGVGTAWLLGWFKSQSQTSGWSCRHLLYDILLGAAVFILSAPMLYGLMALATLVTKTEYDHPLMEAINKDPSNIALAFWVAVIAAPIIEEFGFRVLLQGYFQSLAEKSSLSKLMIALVGRGRISGETIQTPETDVKTQEQALPLVTQTTTEAPIQPPTASSSNPYMPSEVIDPQQHFGQTYPQAQQPQRPLKIWPILLSGTLFGLAHFDYGASWIPLIFFGCVLGWLYQRTNRIWPSLTAHIFCNFIGVTGILMQSLSGIQPPN